MEKPTNDLEQLIAARGKLSRLVGQAKKNGEPAEELIQQVKALSIEINAIKAQLSQAEAENGKSAVDCKASSQGVTKELLPALFLNPNASCAFDGKEKQQDKGGNTEPEISISYALDNDAKDWDDYVRSKPQASVYHLWLFRDVVAKSFNHVCHYLIARDAQGSVCGILPSVELSSPMFGHFIVSMPFFTYGGAIAETAHIEKQLIERLVEEAKTLGVSHLEVRKSFTGLNDLHEKSHKVSMVRALPESKEAFWKEVGSKVRAQVKKADRFELRTVFGKQELLDDFYSVFARNMRDLGTPVYAKHFFKNLLKGDANGQFSIGVTYDKHKPVAACFLMGNNEIREIPWASSLRNAAAKNANMAMYAAVLDNTIEQGYAFFDFGRSSPDAGTYRFKKQWGAKPIPLYWYYWLKDGDELPELNPNNPKFTLLIAVWQRLPVWLSKILGPLVVKYLP